MRKRTAGQRRLAAWLKAQKRSKAALGKLLGVTGQAVSGWASGKNPPEETMWPLIEAVTGIPGIEFLTADEAKKRDERLTRLAALQAARLQAEPEPEGMASATGTDG